MSANSEDPDQTPHYANYAMPMSHKKEARLKWVNMPNYVCFH